MTSSTNALTTYLREEILAQDGQISFAQFMALALYHPEWGYYNNETMRLGKHGDFTTAPEISPLFAQTFARQCVLALPLLDQKNILEIGAGSGQFAKDLLLALESLNCLPTTYYIYEISPSLRKQQQLLLKEKCPHLATRVIWLQELPNSLVAIIIANEVLDALPVHCFKIENHDVKERSVTIDNNNQFTWKETNPSLELKQEINYLRDTYKLADGYESEINLHLKLFIENIAQHLKQGIIFFIDYGYGQREYYHPERYHGTLTCFHQHQKNNNPLINIGAQDITAHVDFTRVISIASDYDFKLIGFTTQSAFLLACGILDIAEKIESTLSRVDQFKLHQAIKLLTLPTEMGELIKVMVLAKNISLSEPLLGLSFLDRRRDL